MSFRTDLRTVQFLDKPFTPTQASYSADGTSITITGTPGENRWRSPGYIGDSTAVLGMWLPEDGNGWEVSVDVKLEAKKEYDQAMVYIHRSPTWWAKVGLERYQGHTCLGSAMTKSWSDWTPHLPSPPSHTETTTTRITITFLSGLLQIYHTPPGAASPILMREIQGFLATPTDVGATKSGEVFVGVMCCSPQGNGETKATFRNMVVELK